MADVTQTHFKDTFKAFKQEVSKLSKLSSAYKNDKEISPLLKPLKESITNIYLEMEKAGDREPTPSPSITTQHLQSLLARQHLLVSTYPSSTEILYNGGTSRTPSPSPFALAQLISVSMISAHCSWIHSSLSRQKNL